MTIENLKKVIIPTAAQAVISLCLSLLLFGITFKDAITNLIVGSNRDIEPYFNQSYQIQLNNFSQLSIVDLLVRAIFFSGAGLIAYLIFLAVSNVIIEARNEAVIETNYVNKDTLSHRWKKPLLQLGTALVLVGFLLISITLFLPFWLSLFDNALRATLSLTTALGFLAAVLGAAFNIYLLWIMAQLVFAID